MLDEIYNSCFETANQLDGWQKLNKNDIANMYLDNRYNTKGNVYAAALLCKYWYKVGLLWKSYGKSMSQEDCYAVVWDGIERAMDYASWRNPENSLYQDPNGPDKAINVCIDSINKTCHTFSSRLKRKANHQANVVSLDSLYDSAKDYSSHLYEDDNFIYYSNNNFVNIYIDELISKNRLPEAIIIDVICYGGLESFGVNNIVREIHQLNAKYAEDFTEEYGVPENTVRECLNSINDLSQYQLNKLIRRTLHLAKKYGGFN